MTILSTLVVIAAISCTILAQRSTNRSNRRSFSLLGGAASILVAVEAAQRGEFGTCFLFTGAAMVSLGLVALDYLKPSNPDA